MASGTKPNWIEVIRQAEAMDWANGMPNVLDSLVLSLDCTCTSDGRLADATVSAIEQGARTYRKRVEAGEKTGLVAVGAGYFNGLALNKPIGSFLMRQWVLDHSEIAGSISPDQIYAEPHSYNTLVNALDSGIPLRGKQIGCIYLTADPLHAPRALKTFRGVYNLLGIKTQIICVPGRMPKYGDSSKWFLRSEIAFRAWNAVGMLLLPIQLVAIKKALFISDGC